MEILITVRENGQSQKHNVICHNFIQGVEDFCADFGIKWEDIVAVVVIDE